MWWCGDMKERLPFLFKSPEQCCWAREHFQGRVTRNYTTGKGCCLFGWYKTFEEPYKSSGGKINQKNTLKIFMDSWPRKLQQSSMLFNSFLYNCGGRRGSLIWSALFTRPTRYMYRLFSFCKLCISIWPTTKNLLFPKCYM